MKSDIQTKKLERMKGETRMPGLVGYTYIPNIQKAMAKGLLIHITG